MHPVDDHDQDATPREGELPRQGVAGLSWRGDGALVAARRDERGPSEGFDLEQPIYRPALDGQPGYPLATFNRRWLGFVLDEAVVLLLLAAVMALLGAFVSTDRVVLGAQMTVALPLLRTGYTLIFDPRGWSPGKRWLRLRIVRPDGSPPGIRYGVVRSAGAVLGRSLFYAGYLWALVDRRNQTWHDKLAGTYVVRIDGEGRAMPSEPPPGGARGS